MSAPGKKRRGFKVAPMKPPQNNGRTLRFVPPQDNKPTSRSQSFDVEQHIRHINRMMDDAYVMFSGWPESIRCGYFVGPDGKLFTIAEKRGGK